MECSEKLIWNKFNKKEFMQVSIVLPDEEIRQAVFAHWDHVAKPIDGLGKFESIIAKLGAISGTDQIDLSQKAVIIMCADNGIVEEGVSQSGQEVTAIVAGKMAERKSSVGKMSQVNGVDTIPVDIGMNQAKKLAGVLDRRIRCGTRNFLKEPAMTEEEAIRAIAVGIELVRECKNAGYNILATGEMGIGNTTTSSAVTASLLGLDARDVTGRGAGLDDHKLEHKIDVIDRALKKYGLRKGPEEKELAMGVADQKRREQSFRALKTVGGLDIAGLVGVCIGGAIYHVPVVLDGVISLAAALASEYLMPGTKEYLIASHKGKEPATEIILNELGLDAVIDGDLALGEGTGAVMMFALLDLALSVYRDRTTFLDMKIEQYERYQKR